MPSRRSAGRKRKRPGRRKRFRKSAPPLPRRRDLQQSTAQLKRQLADISSHLLMTFEEITLLHRLTEHLSISKSVTDIVRAVGQLAGRRDSGQDRSPSGSNRSATCTSQHRSDKATTAKPVLIAHGKCPLEQGRVRPIHRAAWARASRPSRSCSIAAPRARPPGSIRTFAKSSPCRFAKAIACSAGCWRSITPAPATSPTAKPSSAPSKPA